MQHQSDRRVSFLLERMSQATLAKFPALDELSIELNISAGRIRHLFRQHTGKSYDKYLKAVRLELAHQLLRETFLMVKQVRAQVGISDPSHFTKEYRRKFGESPSMTRRRGPR